MLYFRPITYSDADLRAFEFSTSAQSKREGILCYMSGSSLNKMVATAWVGNSPATIPLSASQPATTTFDAKKYFPIFREDQNFESVSGTIAAGN